MARMTGGVSFLLAPVGRREGANSAHLGPERGCPFVPKCPCYRADHAVLTGDSLLRGLSPIAQHMPAVEDVHRSGRPLPDALAVDLGPVAGDDLDAGMAPQPVRHGVGITIGQELRDCVAFLIDDIVP